MDQRLFVDAITKETTYWTFKVQVVDNFQLRESIDQSVQFQTMLVQDENVSIPICLFLLKNGLDTQDVLKKLLPTKTL